MKNLKDLRNEIEENERVFEIILILALIFLASTTLLLFL